MQECLPTLRRLGDRRCAGRALFVLGESARLNGYLARADELLRGSIEAVAVAGQSALLVWGLEALAAVQSAWNEPRTAAELLGIAHHARGGAPLTCDPSSRPTNSYAAMSPRPSARRTSTPPTAQASS